CRTSGCANTAWSDAMVTSAAGWYQKPAPSAQPLTAAMIGLPSFHICVHSPTLRPSLRCQYSRNSAYDLPLGSELRDAPGAGAPWSRPEQNARPAPVKMITLTL